MASVSCDLELDSGKHDCKVLRIHLAETLDSSDIRDDSSCLFFNSFVLFFYLIRNILA